MNVGGVNTSDCMQYPLKVLGQANQDGFSQLLAAIFKNIQNGLTNENSKNAAANELLNGAEQFAAENGLSNIQVPVFSDVPTKNDTVYTKELESWINDILSNNGESAKKEEILAPENTNLSDLVKNISEIISENDGNTVETSKLYNSKNIDKPEAPEDVLSVIDIISTVIVQLYQNNGFENNEVKLQQDKVLEIKMESAEVNLINDNIHAGPVLKVRPSESANLAGIEGTDNVNEVKPDSDLIENNTLAGKSEVANGVFHNIQEKHVDSKVLELLINQVKDKLQAKNTEKVITFEEVVSFIQEVDYKKIIDVASAVEVISRNQEAVKSFKSSLLNGISEAYDTVKIVQTNEKMVQMERSLNSITVDEIDRTPDKIYLTVGHEIPSSTEELIDKKTSVKISANTLDMNRDLINVKTDKLQKDNALNNKTFILNSQDESKPKGDIDFKEILNHHAAQPDINDKNEVSIKKAEGIKVFSRYENIIEAAVKGFKALRLPEINELNVKLKPDELGEIVVKVVLEKGQINGSITAEKKDVVNILQNQVDSLRQELKNNNVNINNISVNIGNEQGSSQHGFFDQNTKREKRNLQKVFTNDPSEENDDGFEIIA